MFPLVQVLSSASEEAGSGSSVAVAPPSPTRIKSIKVKMKHGQATGEGGEQGRRVELGEAGVSWQ